MELLRGAGDPAKRAVLLTFDDGLGQVWSIAWPLPKKYGMRCHSFDHRLVVPSPRIVDFVSPQALAPLSSV